MLAAPVGQLSGQQPQDISARPDSSSTARVGATAEPHSPPGSIWRTALVGAGGAAIATVAAFPLDVPVARAFQSEGPQDSRLLQNGAATFNAVGQPGVLLASVAMYGAGRLSGQPHLTSIGAHATQAIVLSGSVTMLLKIVAGRQRPYVQAGNNTEFDLLGGRKGGRTSFPSGHTTAAFAFASAVSTDLHYWRPEVARVASPLLYVGAAAVGAARMYDDRHWVSDVVLGAAIGTIVGRMVTHNARLNPDNWMDRQFRAVTIAPNDQGLAVGVSHTFR